MAVIGGHGTTAVSVADGRVALVEQRMLRQLVTLHVVVDVFAAPVQYWVDAMPITRLLHAWQSTAIACLTGSQPGQPASCGELFERAFHGFDLANLVVAIQVVQTFAFPQPPETRFHLRGRNGRSRHDQIQVQLFLQCLCIIVCFRRQIASVDPDDGNVRTSLGCQMQQHGRLDAKTGTHDEPVSKRQIGPLQKFLGRHVLNVSGCVCPFDLL